MRNVGILAGALTAGVFVLASAALAAPVGGTGDVTPDVIFGSGNANGDFTGVQANNVEIGLRAKQRFPPANIFNYDGVDTYDFIAGESAPLSGRPLWNFEWSVNSDLSGATGRSLDALTYSLSLDTDPGAGESFTTVFDLINGAPYFDHAIGNNLTPNGGGAVAASIAAYAALIATENVAQNSWAFNWFAAINPLIAGLYRIELAVSDSSGLLASTGINVRVSPIPIPSAAYLFGTVLLGGGLLVRHRRRRRVA